MTTTTQLKKILHSSKSNTVKKIVFMAFLVLTSLTISAQVRAFPENTVHLDTDICRYYPAETPHRSSITVPNKVRENIMQGRGGCATFVVNYTGFTPTAEAAFQFAVDIWSNLLESPVDITVSATFGPLGTNVLGGASSNGFIPLSGAGIPPNTAYPRALAEKIIGSEIADGPNNPSTDINATFSSTANFYFGLDANPSSAQVDFVSVVLHELGHGLGIAGFARVPTDTDGNPDPDPPVEGFLRFSGFVSIWDNFIENGTPAAITSFTDPSAALLSEFTGNDLFCNSTIATNQNSSVKPSTYAPSVFQIGSSYSHWDETTYPAGDPNSLMTPSIALGEAIHDPGVVTLGFMEDMGWSICGGTLSVNELITLDFNISPNPFSSELNIQLSNTFNSEIIVNLYDINGRQILNETHRSDHNNVTIASLGALQKGVYFIKVEDTTGGVHMTRKLIKN